MMDPVQDSKNIDAHTVEGFGREWRSFTQSDLSQTDKAKIFEEYFSIFPWHLLAKETAVGADVGCGSGRWAALVAPKVGKVHLVDASARAIQVAQENLSGVSNVDFHHASVDTIPVPDGSLDFAYSLGVLHCVPDPQQAIFSISAKLKAGAPFLLYLYYAFDNQPYWYYCLWRSSDFGRSIVSRLPYSVRYWISQWLAVAVSWPLARTARLLERFNLLPKSWPLAYYRDKSFYVMRTDSLDRFGTKREQRFTRKQIQAMLERAGFGNIRFSESPPYWCVVGIKS